MWEPKRPSRPSKPDGKHRCKECRGKGRAPGIVKIQNAGTGMGSTDGPCPSCDGTGWVSVDDQEAPGCQSDAR